VIKLPRELVSVCFAVLPFDDQFVTGFELPDAGQSLCDSCGGFPWERGKRQQAVIFAPEQVERENPVDHQTPYLCSARAVPGGDVFI